MIFPSLTTETVMQVEDKFRLDASRSFISGDIEAITDVLIQPELTESFISVFNSDSEKWFLDWAYTTDGIKTITVRVITDLNPTGRDRTYSVNCLSVSDDSLFSSDADLLPYEPDVMNYLPKGKNSYLYAHRKAQDIIIAWLDEQRIWNQDGSRITKQDIAAVSDDEIREQFRQWSTYQTLLVIFESIQVSTGDVFQEKRDEYETMRNGARKRSALRLDLNKDDTLDKYPYDIRTVRMKRR